jgi:hypothetical protein
MSVLTYNCISLGDILTLSVENAPVFDPESGVDLLYNKITLSVQAYVSFVPRGDGTSLLPPMLPGETPAQTMARVRYALVRPRKPLTFTVGGKTLVTALDAANADYGFVQDQNLGPRDNKCTITQLSDQSFLVQFRITTWLTECSTGARPYLALRWTQSQQIDEKHLSTLTTSGTLTINPAVSTRPDALRGFVTPPLHPGFRRVRSRYAVQSDGLALKFEFQDVEQYLQPPPPAVTASGRFMISADEKNGALRYAQCDVTLAGRKDTPKADLMQQAVSIALARLNCSGAGPAADGSSTIVTGSASDRLWDNEVSVSLKALIQEPEPRQLNLAEDLKRYGAPPRGSEPGTQPPDPGTRGTAALIGLAAAGWGDPCLGGAAGCAVAASSASGISAIVLGDGGAPAGNDGIPEAIVSVVPSLGPPATAVPGDTPGVYETCEIRAEYHGDEGLSALPVSGGSAPSAATPGSAGTVVVQLYPRQARKTFSWSITKLGGRPQRPQVASKDPNCVLLARCDSPRQLDRLADSSLRFEISGSASYVYLDGNSPRLAYPIPPWIQLSDAETEALLASQNVSPGMFRDEQALPGWPA